MIVLELNCNQCGAPLEVPPRTRFVTCSFCNTRLQVQQEGAAAFTSTLEDISEDLAAIKRNTEVLRLDQEWAAARDRYVVRSKHGIASIPTAGSAKIGLVAVVGFGVVWTLFTLSMDAPAFFPLFGVLFIGVGVAQGVRTHKKADEYERDLAAYRAERQRLMAE